MTRRIIVSFSLLAICTLGLPVVLRAHPLGTNVVSFALTPDGRQIAIKISADAAALAAKLEALGGTGRAGLPVSIGTLTSRLDEASGTLLAHVALRVGDETARLTYAGATVTPDLQTTVRLIAAAPARDVPVSWQTSLIFGSYPLVIQVPGEDQDRVEWLQGRQESTAMPLTQAGRSHAWIDSMTLGFTHILPRGIDHILFVLGLFFLSTRAKQVLIQVSAFTVAHSITLGLTLYGIVSAPSHVVEPLIALSVAYVGIENVVTSRITPWRVPIVFLFGLLHGMGFAEALANLHLPRSQFLSTLIAFNAGVEGGQLAVIALAAGLLAVMSRAHTDAPAWQRSIRFAASAAIGVFGIVWTIERLL